MGLQTIIIARMCQVGNDTLTTLMLVGAYAGFHFTTLEEYYVGTLHLPMFNAVTDGSIIYILGFITVGVVGPGLMSTEVCTGEWLGIDGVEVLTIG
jgi:hypothetical protein